jgi:hypothetical protein
VPPYSNPAAPDRVSGKRNDATAPSKRVPKVSLPAQSALPGTPKTRTRTPAAPAGSPETGPKAPTLPGCLPPARPRKDLVWSGKGGEGSSQLGLLRVTAS